MHPRKTQTTGLCRLQGCLGTALQIHNLLLKSQGRGLPTGEGAASPGIHLHEEKQLLTNTGLRTPLTDTGEVGKAKPRSYFQERLRSVPEKQLECAKGRKGQGAEGFGGHTTEGAPKSTPGEVFWSRNPTEIPV